MQNKPKLNLPFGLLLCTIILVGFFLTNSFDPLGNRTSTPSEAIVISPKPFKANKSIQIHTLSLITVTPTPTPAPVTTGNGSLDCGQQFTDVNTAIQTLSTSYGIHVVGPDATLDRLQTLAATMCLQFQSTMYQHLLNSVANPITVDLEPGSCAGHASAATGLILYGTCGRAIDMFTFAHELGHMVAFRNPSVYNDWYSHVWPATLPTWDCQRDFYGPGPWPAECFPDMIGEYLVYRQWREAVGGYPPGTATFTQYPTEYASYYNFARDNIFGGVTF